MAKSRSKYLKGFETDRLILRKLTMLDRPVWAEFFLDTTSFEYIGLTDDKEPCDHSEEWLKRQFKRYREGEYGLLAMVDKDTMKLIGQSGLITMNVEKERELEIGYHIIKQYRGKGFATEVATALRDYVFINDLADSVITVININNSISIRVTEKLGFERVGDTQCMGKPSYLYRITKEQWKEQYS